MSVNEKYLQQIIADPTSVIKISKFVFCLFAFLAIGMAGTAALVLVLTTNIWLYIICSLAEIFLAYNLFVYRDYMKFHVDYMVLLYHLSLNLSRKSQEEIDSHLEMYPKYYKEQVSSVVKEMKKIRDDF